MVEDQKYVFIGGAARTGTTLCQSLICSLDGTSSLLPESAQLQLLNEFDRRLEKHNTRFELAFWDSDDSSKLFDNVLQEILKRIELKHRSEYLVLKSPASTPLFPRIGMCFPDRADFLILVRDPRDAIASMIEWGRKASNTGKYIWFSERNIYQLSRYFLSFYAKVLSEMQNPRFTFLRYEKLVENPTEALSEFLKQADMQTPETIRKIKPSWGNLDLSESGPVGASASPLYGKSVSKARVGGYHAVLTEKEIEQIEGHCADFMTLFNYEVSHTNQKSSVSAGLLDSLTNEDAPLQPKSNTSDTDFENDAATKFVALNSKISEQSDGISRQQKKIEKLKAKIQEFTVQRISLFASLEAQKSAVARLVTTRGTLEGKLSDLTTALKSKKASLIEVKQAGIEQKQLVETKLKDKTKDLKNSNLQAVVAKKQLAKLNKELKKQASLQKKTEVKAKRVQEQNVRLSEIVERLGKQKAAQAAKIQSLTAVKTTRVQEQNARLSKDLKDSNLQSAVAKKQLAKLNKELEKQASFQKKMEVKAKRVQEQNARLSEIVERLGKQKAAQAKKIQSLSDQKTALTKKIILVKKSKK